MYVRHAFNLTGFVASCAKQILRLRVVYPGTPSGARVLCLPNKVSVQ